MKTIAGVIAIAVTSSLAMAEPKVTVAPTSARPGEAVLVTVAGVKELPKGEAGGKALQFFRARDTWRAVFAVPLEGEKRVALDVAGVKREVEVRTVTFSEAAVVVEEELANPGAEERKQIDADNAAIVAALAKGDGDPQWSAAFRKPAGKVTSGFGEWRTFNEGNRSQHLGMDVHAKEGTRVAAINAGTVTLVRDTFLAGKVVVVAHGAGIASAYFHLQDFAVKEGDLVTRGQVLGKAGKTGRATGPHLHLAVRVTGGLVDPASFFAKRL